MCENNKIFELDVYKSQSLVEYDFSEVDEDSEIFKNVDIESVFDNKILYI